MKQLILSILIIVLLTIVRGAFSASWTGLGSIVTDLSCVVFCRHA